jgi:hypothetical protein
MTTKRILHAGKRVLYVVILIVTVFSCLQMNLYGVAQAQNASLPSIISAAIPKAPNGGAAVSTAQMTNVYIPSIIYDAGQYMSISAYGHLDGSFTLDFLQWLADNLGQIANVRYTLELWQECFVCTTPLTTMTIYHTGIYEVSSSSYQVTLSETGQTFTNLSKSDADVLLRTLDHVEIPYIYSGSSKLFIKIKATLVIPYLPDENTAWAESPHIDERVIPSIAYGIFNGKTYYVNEDIPFDFYACNNGLVDAPDGYFSMVTSSPHVLISGFYNTSRNPGEDIWNRFHALMPTAYPFYEWNLANIQHVMGCQDVTGDMYVDKPGSYWVESRLTLGAPAGSAASGTYVGIYDSTVSTDDQQGWYSQHEEFTVIKADPAVNITNVSPEPSIVNQVYTVSVTVSGDYGTPTGTVAVSDGSANCTATLADGSGSCGLASTTVGQKTLTAYYSGDTTYNQFSNTTSHTVNPAPLQPSTTAITDDSPDPSIVNQGYTVSVTVSGSYGVPTGWVDIDDGSAGCAATLSGGSGSCVLTSTTTGTKTLTAVYSGDSTYNGSNGTTSHTVNPATSPDLIIESITGLPANPTPGQPIDFTVRVKNQGSGDAAGNFYVDFYIDAQPTGCQSAGTTYWLVNSLVAGASQDLLYHYSGFSTVGTHNLYAFADSYCVIAESDETNNILGPIPVTVNPPSQQPSTTAITDDAPDPSIVNQGYTVSVTVTGSYGAPTGTVGIDDGSAACMATLSGGSGSCVLTSTTTGAKTLTAFYSGDITYSPSSATTSHTVNPVTAPDLIIESIAAVPASPNTGQNVDFTVRVKNQGNADVPGNFYVDFFIDTQPGGCGTDGFFHWMVNSLAAGASQDLSFTYVGFSTAGMHNLYAFADSFCAISESDENNNILGPVPITAGQPTQQPSTTTFISDSPDPSIVNQGYTVSVTVSGSYGAPTGTVVIDDGSVNCTATLVGGSGSCLLTSTTTGMKTLTATYSGDGTYNPSSNTAPHTVNPAPWPSTTTITDDSPDPSIVNQGYTVSVTVSGSYGTPTGTVDIDDGSASCTATLSGGSGSCGLTSTTTGTKTLTANYSGDGTYNPSSSTASHTVNPASAPDLIVESITGLPANPAPGQAVDFTVRIKNLGSTDVTGSFYVDFFVDAQPGGCRSDGIFYWTINSLAAGASQDLAYQYPGFSVVGTHNVYAFADSYCQVSESDESNNVLGPVGVTVSEPALQPSVTTITDDSPDPSLVNQGYTVSVTVDGAWGTPTGTVDISDGSVNCSTTVSGVAGSHSGFGACTLASLTPGGKTLTASYSGDSTYSPSSNTASHTVNQPSLQPSTTAITDDSPDPTIVSQSYTVSVTVTGSSGTPTGTVAINDGSASCTATLSGGSGSCSLASTIAGAKTLTAAYSGDSTYDQSSNTASHMVKAVATVTLKNLSQVYDGTPRSVSAVTDPAGLPVTLTYNGSTTPPTNAGSYPVTGTVNDSLYTGTASGILVIDNASTTIGLASSNNPSFTGPVTFTATVTSPSGAIPVGSVTFTIDGVPFVVSLDAAGVATLTTSALSPGSHSVSVTFSGSPNFAPSGPSSLTQSILFKALIPLVKK